MSNNYIVYCLTNRVNGKKYVGLTMQFHQRWAQHCKYNDSFIARSIRKNGKHNFRITVLVSGLSVENAGLFEVALIAKLNTIVPNGYNIAVGGEGGGNKLAGYTDRQMADYLKKLSDAQTIAQNRPEARQRSSETQKIVQNRPDVKKKNSESCLAAWRNDTVRREKIAERNRNITGIDHASSKYQKDTKRGQLFLFSLKK